MKRLLVVLILFFAGCTPAPMPSHPIESCVLVYDMTGGHGSGAIVGVNLVLTAKHVAVNANLMVKTNSGEEYIVERVIEDPDSDAALLVIKGEFDEIPLKVCITPLQVGDKVLLVGTPYERTNFNCELPGTVVKVDMECDYGMGLMTNLDVNCAHGGPGCSGGPLMHDGMIAGIEVAGQDMLGAALPSEEFAGDLGLL